MAARRLEPREIRTVAGCDAAIAVSEQDLHHLKLHVQGSQAEIGALETRLHRLHLRRDSLEHPDQAFKLGHLV